MGFSLQPSTSSHKIFGNRNSQTLCLREITVGILEGECEDTKETLKRDNAQAFQLNSYEPKWEQKVPTMWRNIFNQHILRNLKHNNVTAPASQPVTLSPSGGPLSSLKCPYLLHQYCDASVATHSLAKNAMSPLPVAKEPTMTRHPPRRWQTRFLHLTHCCPQSYPTLALNQKHG